MRCEWPAIIRVLLECEEESRGDDDQGTGEVEDPGLFARHQSPVAAETISPWEDPPFPRPHRSRHLYHRPRRRPLLPHRR